MKFCPKLNFYQRKNSMKIQKLNFCLLFSVVKSRNPPEKKAWQMPLVDIYAHQAGLVNKSQLFFLGVRVSKVAGCMFTTGLQIYKRIAMDTQ